MWVLLLNSVWCSELDGFIDVMGYDWRLNYLK